MFCLFAQLSMFFLKMWWVLLWHVIYRELYSYVQFCRQKFESLRDEKDHEIFNVREQSQKLQVQLNNGFSGFKDFKEKKAKEIQSLLAQIEDLSKETNEKCAFGFSYLPSAVIFLLTMVRLLWNVLFHIKYICNSNFKTTAPKFEYHFLFENSLCWIHLPNIFSRG